MLILKGTGKRLYALRVLSQRGTFFAVHKKASRLLPCALGSNPSLETQFRCITLQALLPACVGCCFAPHQAIHEQHHYYRHPTRQAIFHFTAFHSLMPPKAHYATLVSARPRSHRLRYGFLLTQSRAY